MLSLAGSRKSPPLPQPTRRVSKTMDTAAPTNPHGPSGPCTEAGKQRSSRNAMKNGLFAAHDFIREGETEEYTQTLISLMNQLSPEGVLEETFATEIMGATWRLRRCRLV